MIIQILFQCTGFFKCCLVAFVCSTWRGSIIAYGCVTSGFHSTKSSEKISEADAEWRLNTKVADEIKKLKNLFIPEEIIKIDVIDSTRRQRKHLENALRTMGHGDTIIISSLNSLGINNDELVKNYKRIYDAGIGLLLPDYKNPNGLSIYATTDYSFSPLTVSKEEFDILCKKLSMQEIKSNRGRKLIEISEDFKTIYWYYERYLIDPSSLLAIAPILAISLRSLCGLLLSGFRFCSFAIKAPPFFHILCKNQCIFVVVLYRFCTSF